MNYEFFLWEPALCEDQVLFPFIFLDGTFPSLGQSLSMHAIISTLHIFRILSVKLSFLWHSVLQILSILVSPVSQLCLLISESPPCSLCVIPSQPRNILMAGSGGSHGVHLIQGSLSFVAFYSVFWKFCFIFIGCFFKFFGYSFVYLYLVRR